MKESPCTDYFHQFVEIFETIEPQSTRLCLDSAGDRSGFISLLEDFIRENGCQGKVEFEHLIEFSRFIEEQAESLSLMTVYTDTLKRAAGRVIDACAGEAVFIGDHNHIYQPHRFDSGFADFIHQKISRECYERMSRLYRFFSVDVGPTLVEWFRIRRPDIYGSLLKSHRIEPFMAQSYTHRILPLIKEDEDLEAEIEAGLMHYERTFGGRNRQRPLGLWLPECCIDQRSAAAIAKAGVDFVVLRSDQSKYLVDPGKVYALKLKNHHKPLFAFYYHSFSKEFSFDKWTTDNPALTLNHLLAGAKKDHYYLLAHDGELVHHRYEHCGVDVTGFFREFPLEAARRTSPSVILITPGRYLRFLNLRASMHGEPLALPETELPDFPTSWSCGGYAIKTFYDTKGITVDSLSDRPGRELIDLYVEFLVLRDLQCSHHDPVVEDTWKMMVKVRHEEMALKYSADDLTEEDRHAIMEDMRRGVNICYDNRRYLSLKVAGAGRWAYGSLDSGDSIYQTYLHEAASLLEERVHHLLCARTDGLFRNRAEAKAFYLAYSMDRLEVPGEGDDKYEFLQKHYSETVTHEEALQFKSINQFFDDFLCEPHKVASEQRAQIFELFRIWSLIRAAKTSCAYFFDDLNNHVAEDAIIRMAEVIHWIEDLCREKVPVEVYDNLKKCSSRYRNARGQGPDRTAYEIAMGHINILRIQHSIMKYEAISLEEFNKFLKENPYHLPHPEGSSREYYRAFIHDRLIGFTSLDGIEHLLSKLSREVARTSMDTCITVEKRDLDSGEIINRLQMDVKYNQLIAEKPYAVSEADANVYVSLKLEDRDAAAAAHFTVNSLMPLLADYGADIARVNTIYVDGDRFSFDYAEPHSRSRREGPSETCDCLHLKRNVSMANLTSMHYNLRTVRAEMKQLLAATPGLDFIDPVWMEKLPAHLDHLTHNPRIGQALYGHDEHAGILKKIERNPAALETLIEEGLQQIYNISQTINLEVVRLFILQRVFMAHDFAMGKYEIEKKARSHGMVTAREAVEEYCREHGIPCAREMVLFKLWKYRKEEVKKYWNLVKEEDRITRFLHQNLIFASHEKKGIVYTMLTHPILYLHGAGNEVNNETFYPDNEVIPRLAESIPGRPLKACFFAGSAGFSDQYSYLKKIRRYLGEKFAIREIGGALFATGEKREIERTREKDSRIFVIPSPFSPEALAAFSPERQKEMSSSHLDISFDEDLRRLLDYMDECDIIYIGGGNSFILGSRLMALSFRHGSGTITFSEALKRFILRGGLVMTLSAGTMVSGVRNVCYKVKRMDVSSDIEGLSLVRAVMQVHFEEYGLLDHLKEIRKKYPSLPAMGIDTLTGLIDSSSFRITSTDEDLLTKPWFAAELDSVTCTGETLTAMGFKSLTIRQDITTLHADGQSVDLGRGLIDISGVPLRSREKAAV